MKKPTCLCDGFCPFPNTGLCCNFTSLCKCENPLWVILISHCKPIMGNRPFFPVTLESGRHFAAITQDVRLLCSQFHFNLNVHCETTVKVNLKRLPAACAGGRRTSFSSQYGWKNGKAGGRLACCFWVPLQSLWIRLLFSCAQVTPLRDAVHGWRFQLSRSLILRFCCFFG